MLQLSDVNYDITPECFWDVLTNQAAFQNHISFPVHVKFCKKVSFDPFKEIIYIPKYNKEYIPHLWWSMRELKYIQQKVKQEISYIMQNSLIDIDMKCALSILCEYND
jgi:hypothetical protein